GAEVLRPAREGPDAAPRCAAGARAGRHALQDSGDACAAAGDHRRLSHPEGRQPRSVRARGAAADPRRRRVVAPAPAAGAQGQDGGGRGRLRVRARGSGPVPHLRALSAEHGRREAQGGPRRGDRQDRLAEGRSARAAEGQEPAGGARRLSARARVGAGEQHRRRLGRVARSVAAVHQRGEVRRRHRRRRAARGQEVPGEDEPQHADAGAGQGRRGAGSIEYDGRQEMMRAHNYVAALLCSCTMALPLVAGAQTPAKKPAPVVTPAPSGAAATPKTTPPAEPDPWKGRNDLFIPPNLHPTTKVNVGAVSRSTTPNGMLLITVPRHQIPSVDVTLAVRVPDTAEPIDKTGLAQMVASMLRKGTQKRTADQISDAVDFVGANVGAQAEGGGIYISCHARTRNLSLCLALVSDMAMNATFPESEMGEERDQMMANVNSSKDNPQVLAAWHAANVFYGDDDPRGRPMSKKSIEAIQRPDLVAFRDKWFAPNNAILAVSGDVDE